MIIVEISSESDKQDVEFFTQYASLSEWFEGEHEGEELSHPGSVDNDGWFDGGDHLYFEAHNSADASTVREFRNEKVDGELIGQLTYYCSISNRV